MQKAWLNAVSLQDEKGRPSEKDCGTSLENGQDKETGSFVKPLEATPPCLHLILA